MRAAKIAALVLAIAGAARPAAAAALSGIDVLERSDFAALAGKRVGVITNQTAVDSSGRNTVDALFAAKSLTLAAIFSPEHGFRGDHRDGDHVSDSTDAATGLPIYSLYGKTRRPTEAMLRGLDVLVFDIQDVGARHYTYLSTMALCMEEAAKRGLEFVVLDRPDPLGGTEVEGPVREGPFDFTDYFPVPTRHGLTAGETARLHADVKGLKLKLTVIRVAGWSRGDLYDATGLRWINPSPNIRNLDAALLYPGLGLFEAAAVSVGRGTDEPFLWFGAPGLDAASVVRALEAAALPGLRFSEESRTPTEDIYAGRPCRGVRIEVLDRSRVRALDVFVRAVCAMRGQKDLRLDSAAPGKNLFRAVYDSVDPPEKILAGYEKSWRAFAASREKYLLY